MKSNVMRTVPLKAEGFSSSHVEVYFLKKSEFLEIIVQINYPLGDLFHLCFSEVK